MEILPHDIPEEERDAPPRKEYDSPNQDVHLMLCQRLAYFPARNKGPLWRRLFNFLRGE